MSGINDTAYPQLKTEISDQELLSVVTPATRRGSLRHARVSLPRAPSHICSPNASLAA